MKTVRTKLYGDSEFLDLELELLHTPIMQRLYNLKQLGFTDKIYPDAVHSRFNHILGVVQRADKIINGIVKSLENESLGNGPDRKYFIYGKQKINIKDLIDHVKDRRYVVRLIALLHDIGHIPFGHTLEDELHVFSKKHDSPLRQVKFFNILTREFMFSIIQNHNPIYDRRLLDIVINEEPDAKDEDVIIDNFIIAFERMKIRYGNITSGIEDFLINLKTSMTALFYLDGVHGEKGNELQDTEITHAQSQLLLDKLITKCKVKHKNGYKDFNIYLDTFTLDVIGNTICADLLDYIKRDCEMAGLHYDYDERIFKYFTLVSCQNSYANDVVIHVSLQVFTNKLRYDVLSEIITTLRTRYILAERVLFHPTKCAAGAMLGSAVYMMGITEANFNIFRIGDEVFIQLLVDYSRKLNQIHRDLKKQFESSEHEIVQFLQEIINKNQSKEIFPKDAFQKVIPSLVYYEFKEEYIACFAKILLEEYDLLKAEVKENGIFINESTASKLIENIGERLFSAKRLIWQIQARQYYKKIFRIAKIDHKIPFPVKKQLSNFFMDAKKRFDFERKLEQKTNLPYGTIVIHCPKFDTSLKAAKVLVFGSDPSEVTKLNAINEDHELYTLKPYVDEANNLEGAYKSIWNLYFYVHQPHMHIWPFIEQELEKMLEDHVEGGIKINNSKDLRRSLVKEFGGLAKIHLDTLKSISEMQDVKPEYNLDLVEFLETQAFKNKKADVKIEELLNEWLQITINARNKQEKN